MLNMKYLFVFVIFICTCSHTHGQNHLENTLVKLKDKEQLSIVYHTIGCFHNVTFKLVVTRTDKNWEAGIYESQNDLLGYGGHFYYMFDDGYLLLKRKVLTAGDLQAFSQFETALRKIDQSFSFCTTNDDYAVKSNYYNAQVRDGNCNWNGFRTLMNSWFVDLQRAPNFAECLF